MSTKETSSKYDCWVISLVVAMFVLVLVTIGWVVTDFFINRSYHKQVKARLEAIQYITVDAVEFADSTHNFKGKILSAKDIKDLLDQKILNESTIIDSNNYLAIILTLITLCVSLSVVIPYIVGRAVSSKDIKDRVDELYAQQVYDSSKRYKENVNMLLASEAHLSRMTAYELMTIYHYNTPNTSVEESTFSSHKHPAWAIGWASKALFRYVVIDNQSYKNFCKDLCGYITQCDLWLSSSLGSYRSIADRAFYDLFNALTYHSTLENRMLDGLTKDLTDCLKSLASRLYTKDSITENDIKNNAEAKSHKYQYLDSENLRERYDSCAEKLAKDVKRHLESTPQLITN